MLEFLSDLEKSEIVEATKQCKGKLGLVALKTHRTLPLLQKILKENLELKIAVENEQKTFDKVFEDICDIQLKVGIISGEPWALSHVLNKNKSISDYLKLAKNKITNGQNKVSQLGEELEYHEDFDEIAYEVLSSSPFNTKAHLCETFGCGEKTISKWITSNPTFNDSIDRGLSEGEAKARNLLLMCAFEPQTKVNTALLKVLSSNVYKIEEEPQAVVVNNNIASSSESIEDMMKARGIPMPLTGGMDLEEISI